MTDLTQEQIFNQILERIKQLMNSPDPLGEINKFVTMEYTTNEDAREMGHLEVLSLAIVKLATFYGDQKLIDLWESYLALVDPLFVKMSA